MAERLGRRRKASNMDDQDLPGECQTLQKAANGLQARGRQGTRNVQMGSAGKMDAQACQAEHLKMFFPAWIEHFFSASDKKIFDLIE